MSIKNRLKLHPTPIQIPVISSINNAEFTVLTGEAGSGKNFISLYYALSSLYNKDVEKIIISKPLVEVGRSIGFLPGLVSDKYAEYSRSLLEIIDKLIGTQEKNKFINDKKISFEPLQFMRGDTYNNACIILSEAQNATLHQLISFLTRKASTSKMILNGDLLQSDISNSGLSKMLDILTIDELNHIKLGEEFQMRDPVITKINRLYRSYLNSKQKPNDK